MLVVTVAVAVAVVLLGSNLLPFHRVQPEIDAQEGLGKTSGKSNGKRIRCSNQTRVFFQWVKSVEEGAGGGGRRSRLRIAGPENGLFKIPRNAQQRALAHEGGWLVRRFPSVPRRKRALHEFCYRSEQHSTIY